MGRPFLEKAGLDLDGVSIADGRGNANGDFMTLDATVLAPEVLCPPGTTHRPTWMPCPCRVWMGPGDRCGSRQPSQR